MDIMATLQDEMDNLSRSEQRIADIVLSDTSFAMNASIIELAARAEVSPPTVTRFCRRLNCQSFSEFKVRIAQTAYIGTRYLNPETEAQSARDIAENIVTKAQSALYSVHGNLDVDLIEKAAAKVANAGMVYAFGSGGNSAMLANELQNRLFRLGLRVTASADHTMQLMLAAAMQPDDVIIASSFSGRNMELVRTIETARGYKALAIALTRPDSPVAAAADIVLPVDLREGVRIMRPTSSRYAFLILVDILANLVAVKRNQAAVEPLRRIKQQLVTYRDKDDSEVLGD
ncbi:MurR/RpiR family transcriptional regulator [Pelagibacterium xiamenense]|uniref:MurR/RpiR family transcriptional regulator n=1 Tax=Pelagibacterium xiamenense TaxID=2901140 RepID=UPI001E4C798D|nr:MurR/RpiR family transcriptional regulator [Pelagibacterium xiamenense]MCD7059137.1 MurR/RpiR family transcriptional regulator [Pelagibacterium xiamenense]